MSNPFNLKKIPFEYWEGTFDHGRDEEVAEDHLIDSLNVRYTPKGVKTREGSVISVPVTVPAGETIVRHYFKRADGYGRILIYMTNTGKIYGIRNGITTLLLTIPTAEDFSITSTANFVYISPHDRVNGTPGEKVYRWDGTNVRQAAGLRPTAGSVMTATTTGTGVDEVQRLTIGGVPSAGNLPILTKYGITVPLPFNFTGAQLESALRGDNERQAIWVEDASGGTLTAEHGGNVSAPFAFNATAATVKTALEGIPTLGVGNIDVLGGTGTVSDPWIVLYIGSMAKQEQSNLILNGAGLTGSTPSAHIEEVLKGRKLFGVGNIVVTGVGPFDIQFTGDEGEQDQEPLIPINQLTGAAPTATITTLTNGSTAGNIDEGKHFFAVAFETESGFITKLGPTILGTFTPTEYDAPGDKKVLIANIPVGPAGTIARHVVMTKANETEYFFIPNGRIGDNVTTTLEISAFDSELVESADYLLDILETIPACLQFIKYRSRVVLVGFPNPDGSIARVSLKDDPETFDETEGFIRVEPDDQHNLKTGFEHQGMIYFGKSLGWYATEDNNLEPLFWDKPIAVDQGVSAQVFGVSEIPNFLAGTTRERIVVVDASGILLFQGGFGEELTWKIRDIWQDVNRDLADKIQIIDDPVNKCLFCNVPLGLGSEDINAILFGDYTKCGETPNAKDIKWSVWKFPGAPISISCFDLDGKGNPILRFNVGGVLYRLCRALDSKNDFGNVIASYIRLPYVAPPGSDGGEVNFYGAIRIRSQGIGNLYLVYFGEDNLPVSQPPVVLNSAQPAREYLRLTNFKSERVSIKIGVDTLDSWFYITRVNVFGDMYAVQRPA